MLVHSVYFYLKPELTAEQRAEFRRQVATLAEVPTLTAFYPGSPAPVPPRPIVDTTYDVSITCIFRDVEAHNAYQVHPVHTAFVEKCRDLWSRVQIYDSQG